MEATIWAVPKGHELNPKQCVALMRESKTWQSVDCDTDNLVPACVDVENPRHWQLGSVSVVEADAAVACASLSSSTVEYSVPASGYENGLLHDQLMQHAPSSVAGVWLNAKVLVSEVYSTKQNEVVAPVVHETRVSPIDEIVSVE
ncbi:hypothetical protein L915_18565 [Phytophthora nicotianae]|nr:hypothetical protein L915_18565 [Phytophthora nicotianae]ETM34566.1 hypothetical protein L914_18379 [Phytophthora nicotianae]